MLQSKDDRKIDENKSAMSISVTERQANHNVKQE